MKTADAAFQGLWLMLFETYNHNAYQYVENITVYSPTIEQHHQDLNKVFSQY